MRLISLKLENFRQHADSKIEFSEGITTIIGANGSGKSTILEAVSWTIYGAEAARGTKDSIRWIKASAKSKVRTELIFEFENEIYRAIRWLDKAEVYQGDNQTLLAVGQQEVTKYLTDKIGMTRDEFFNTYFTGQKELNFLGGLKPIDRRRFISKVLNYEKVREAQEKVRIDKNNLNNEIMGMKQGLVDIEKIESEKAKIQEQLNFVRKNLEIKLKERDTYALKLGKLHPDWSKIKSTRENFNKCSTELDFIVNNLGMLEKNAANLSDEYASLEVKSKKLAELREYYDKYKQTEALIQEQEKLQRFENERQRLLNQFENINKDISELEKKKAEIFALIDSEKNAENEAILLKNEIIALEKQIQDKKIIILVSKQELKTLRIQKEKELEKVATQKALIEQKGEDGACPTCERPLKNEFNKVISQFDAAILALSREIQAIVRQEEILTQEPESFKEIIKTKEEKEKTFEALNKIKIQREMQKKQHAEIENIIPDKEKTGKQLHESLGQIPQGFDGDVLDRLRKEIIPLKEKYEEIITLNSEIKRKDRVKQDLEAAIANKNKSHARKQELEAKLKELNYSEDNYKKLEELVLKNEKSYNEAKDDVLKLEGDLKQSEAFLNAVLHEEKTYKDKQIIIKSKQDELNHLIELDRFYGRFLEKLNNQARPELSEFASRFLSELTDGRYSLLELNEKYEICLFDGDEIKPVISGGEEDIANLCLRLAISQMIAQRSGKTLSLLILDEIFGSLDENRRNNVVSLLHNLKNCFEQIILITHIDDVKENADSVIRVEYDAENEFSVVNSENFINDETLISL